MSIEITPVFVDWLTAIGGGSFNGSWLQKNMPLDEALPTKTAYHHSHAVHLYPSGWRYYFTPQVEDVQSVTVLDGTALANIRRMHDNDWCLKTVAQIANASSHFTRIDLTVDIIDKGQFSRDLADYLLHYPERMAYLFPRRKVTIVRSTGTTVYVGSRQSPLLLRIYDKYAESSGEIPATRIEIELKGHYAKECHRIMKGYDGWLKPTALYKGFVRSLSTWEGFPIVQAILDGEVTMVDKEEREPKADTKEWLKRQVLPTFTRDWNHGGSDLWFWMIEQVNEALGLSE